MDALSEFLTPEQRKTDFLTQLKRSGKYKRYSASPLRYVGGKSLAVGQIIELIPPTVSRLISPFIGGGSVEIACANELRLPVIAFDFFDILVNYWQVQLNATENLSSTLLSYPATREHYKEVKGRLTEHWRRKATIDDAVELAAHYWFNHNLSYGPYFLGWWSSLYDDKNRVARAIRKVAEFRCERMQVEQANFKDVLPEFKNDFLYCDPPYYLNGDSKMFHGIYPSRNFPVHHDRFEHGTLRDMLHSHNGGFVLSYNDCSTIREWYADFQIIEVGWQYTLGMGETRIGKNRVESGEFNNVKKSHELLIVKN